MLLKLNKIKGKVPQNIFCHTLYDPPRRRRGSPCIVGRGGHNVIQNIFMSQFLNLVLAEISAKKPSYSRHARLTVDGALPSVIHANPYPKRTRDKNHPRPKSERAAY